MIIWKAIKWTAGEIWEKINIFATWRELKALGKKHGKRFFFVAVTWELIEDGLFPVLSWYAGVPELIPLFLIFHFEPIAYPVFFWAFRMWDRYQGREPWDPDRPAHSTYMRTTMKVSVYEAAIFMSVVALFQILGLPLWQGVVFILLMGAYDYVHERIWHDANWGIIKTDMVEMKRNVAKTFTFRLVSFIMMCTLFYATVTPFPFFEFLAYQGLMTVLYFGLEVMWSQSAYGIETGEQT